MCTTKLLWSRMTWVCAGQEWENGYDSTNFIWTYCFSHFSSFRFYLKYFFMKNLIIHKQSRLKGKKNLRKNLEKMHQVMTSYTASKPNDVNNSIVYSKLIKTVVFFIWNQDVRATEIIFDEISSTHCIFFTDISSNFEDHAVKIACKFIAI